MMEHQSKKCFSRSRLLVRCGRVDRPRRAVFIRVSLIRGSLSIFLISMTENEDLKEKRRNCFTQIWHKFYILSLICNKILHKSRFISHSQKTARKKGQKRENYKIMQKIVLFIEAGFQKGISKASDWLRNTLIWLVKRVIFLG